MDDFDNDRDSNASSDEQPEHDDTMTMEEADDMDAEEDDVFNEDDEDQEDADQDGEGDGDNEGEGEGEHDAEDQEADPNAEAEGEGEGDGEGDGEAEGEGQGEAGDGRDHDAVDPTTRVDAPGSSSALHSPTLPRLRPRVRPEALTARLYDIVPTMAAPQATSINAIAITPDLRYWMTGGSDGYVRKYDGPGTINGKQLLTVAQRHPFVDSVVKAGILMSYWENFEPPPPDKGRSGTSDEDRVLSPVYSLAVQKEALWNLAGLESGGINIHSVRYDEGKVIHTIPAQAGDHEGHSNAVSVLQLMPTETNVLSGSWDKRIFDWDLNTGSIVAKFEGGGGQISAIELRPQSGAPISAEAAEEPAWGDTFRGSSRINGLYGNGLEDSVDAHGAAAAPAVDGMADGDGGGGSDQESLFGSPGGSLFGEGQMGTSGGNAFGGDDDNEFSHAMLEPLEAPPGDVLDDTAMEDPPAAEPEAPTQPESQQDTEMQEAKPEPSSPAIEINGRPTTSDGTNAAAASAQELPPSEDTQSTSAATATGAAASSDNQAQQEPTSPSLVFNPPPPLQNDPTQTSDSTFLAASIDGTIRIWDRRMPRPVARISTRPGVPPWCMGACWSPDGNMIYAGRRNGTVEEFNIHNARGGYPGWQPERALKFPAGSGAVSAVRHMPNGRHLVCASHDILRLYDLQAAPSTSLSRQHHSGGSVPFLIIPGPPRAGVISQLYIDPTARFMITAAGTRGWEGNSTEVLIGYEIGCVNE